MRGRKGVFWGSLTVKFIVNLVLKVFAEPCLTTHVTPSDEGDTMDVLRIHFVEGATLSAAGRRPRR